MGFFPFRDSIAITVAQAASSTFFLNFWTL